MLEKRFSRLWFRLPAALDNRPLRFDEFWIKPIKLFLFQQLLDRLKWRYQRIVEQIIRPTGFD